MLVAKYEARKHLDTLKEWGGIRDVDKGSLEDLPAIGFISLSDDSIPLACAFLREIEGKYALLDGLITNPFASSLERHCGITGVINAILLEGHHRGIKKILAYSADKGTLERSKNHGFTHLPHTMIALDLRGGE